MTLTSETTQGRVSDTTVLPADRFSMIASGGLGRTSAVTAHSMTYFRDKLYVGTSYANPILAEDAPRILRYDPGRGEWKTVYESPLIDPQHRSHVPDRATVKEVAASGNLRRRDRPLPRDAGYRSMCVFQGKTDDAPALYASTMSRTGGLILRSAEGETFEPVSEPGFGDPDIYSFRGLVALGDRIFAGAAGLITDEYLDRDIGREAKIYVSDDPRTGHWVTAAEIGFGDSSNLAVSAVASAFGCLYAGTANSAMGFQLWQTKARGSPPFDWVPVIVDGAGAFNHNYAVSALAEFKGALYVGSGITGFGYDTAHDIGPASCELLRAYPDGNWDLIAGQMRFTPDGLKLPLSLLGPGLGDFYNSLIRSLSVHNEVLYLGTHQWEAFRCLQIGAPDIVGGYQLWGSIDGERWTPIIDDGRGNPTQLGIPTLQSTPHGLFVGTSNHSRLFSVLDQRPGSDVDFAQGFEVLLGR
jgi:hypothetical protein